MNKKISDCLPPFFIGLIMMIGVVFFLWIQNNFIAPVNIPKNPAFVRGMITDYQESSYRDGHDHKRYKYKKIYSYSYGDDEGEYVEYSPLSGSKWIFKNITVVVDKEDPVISIPLIDLMGYCFLYGVLFFCGALAFLASGYNIIYIIFTKGKLPEGGTGSPQ